MSSPDDLCQVCDRTREQHNNSGTVHQFTPPGTPVDTRQFARKRPTQGDAGESPGAMRGMTMGYTQTPFDPVLRQALMDKGILTIEDLEAAQRKIGVLTQTVTGGRGVTRSE